ncbi:hypothetical protein Z043_118401, partial [Scleropages formosus]
VVFSRHCSPCDIRELLCLSSNIPRNTAIMLVDSEGAMISIDPTMPTNSPKAFRVSDLKTEVTSRLAMLEKRVELEGLKAVEIEKIYCPCKYNFSDDGKKLSPRRDVPSYPKMLSCLEYMYHDLGLVKEFNMNPITLKRWLLSIQENYRNNPFHNFRHCFCVSQMMYGMIHLCNLQ